MRIVKLVGVIAGALLIVFIAPVLLGMIGGSSIALLSVIVLGLIIAALMWGRRMDATASKVWFIRTHERGTTELQDRLLQDIDDLQHHSPGLRQLHDAE